MKRNIISYHKMCHHIVNDKNHNPIFFFSMARLNIALHIPIYTPGQKFVDTKVSE